MIEHVLTKEQAVRLNRLDLVGKTILIDRFRNNDHEFPIKERIAENIFYNDQRLGGNFCLDE